jgi:hypothetical protein
VRPNYCKNSDDCKNGLSCNLETHGCETMVLGDASANDGPTDATPTDAVSVDSPPGTYPLMVKNYTGWCSVSVNGGASISSPFTQVVDLVPGTYSIQAIASGSMFEVSGNMWHHTDGDIGSGDPGQITQPGGVTTSTAMVTIGSAAVCVWVCCPANGGTGCPGPRVDDCL